MPALPHKAPPNAIASSSRNEKSNARVNVMPTVIWRQDEAYYSDTPAGEGSSPPASAGISRVPTVVKELNRLGKAPETSPRKVQTVDWRTWIPCPDPEMRKKLWKMQHLGAERRLKKEQLEKEQAAWSTEADAGSDNDGGLDDCFQISPYVGPLLPSKYRRHPLLPKTVRASVLPRRPASPAMNKGYVAEDEDGLVRAYKIRRIVTAQTPPLDCPAQATIFGNKTPSTPCVPSTASSHLPTPLETPVITPLERSEDEDILWMRQPVKRPELYRRNAIRRSSRDLALIHLENLAKGMEEV
ncbi:hypothetical protein NliqN6_0092 [Naganishia liquefaciens]|uniref:Uncharacterized protein n=1 Tax=Naganishia liquefaciens TaxID=104408 RepID=A0A8H3TMA1_9TREE|nr:hypothetical protein NliqN6_0092 [Naganishia liquefaciens]